MKGVWLIPRPKDLTKVRRTDQEAWALALANEGLVYSRIAKILKSNTNTWYQGKSLLAEIESYAWEGMFKACKYWDESKGRLSSYAVPSIDRTMYQALKILFRLGGNVRLKGSEAKPSKEHRIPFVLPTSLLEYEKRIRFDPNASDLDSSEIISQLKETTNPSFEDELIDRISFSNLKTDLEDIVKLMEEPYATIYSLMHLAEPLYDRANRPGTAGWTLRDVADKLGVSKETVREKLIEAEEFVYNQLLVRGYGKDEE